MKTIGIRELRQNASAYLRRVEAGEAIQIADRGRPVALWLPIPGLGGLEQLRLQMRLREAQGDLLALSPPLKPRRGRSAPSRVLAEARDQER
jgi:prevent-host-death family protein